MHAVHELAHDSTIESLRSGFELDNELQQQLADHVLRELEARRLPQMLSLRADVAAGRTLSTSDHDEIAQLIRLLDELMVVQPIEADTELRQIREALACLCDEIITAAYANQQ